MAERVTGADVLAIVTRAILPELSALGERLFGAYQADDYKDHFAWIDQMRPVKDPALVEVLNDDLVNRLRDRELDDAHLAAPEILDWQRLPVFAFSPKPDEDDLETDPRISTYRDRFDDPADITLERLKRDRVYAFGGDGEAPITSWSVYRCLVYEHSGEALNVLSSGQWYSVAPSFAEEVAADLALLPELDLDLPPAPLGIDEGEYNELAARETGWLCMDRQLVRLTGLDPVELCDLLSRDSRFVHVKRRGSSSTLSHLFAQGAVVAQLISAEQRFRDESRRVVEGLDADFVESVPADRPEADQCEIGFVVVTRSDRNTPLTLPFFSQVNLRNAARQLQGLGFRTTVKRVREG